MKPYKNIKVAGVTYSEHKYVWEQANGTVPAGYVVHHINHDKRDNKLENLQLMTYEEHSRHHNDKHARIKTCVVCEEEYTPHATKRARQQSGPHFITCEQCEASKQVPKNRIGKARFCSSRCSARRHLLTTATNRQSTSAAAVVGAAMGLDWASAVEREYGTLEMERAA